MPPVEGAPMDKSYQALILPTLGESLPQKDGYVEARYLCACNQTRGNVLGKEVACGDFSFANLLERMPRLTPESAAGLWLIPFKGIPTEDTGVLLDLIYLDVSCRVLAVVDLFPAYRVSPSIPPAASVLALPTDSIFSSGTQAGDQVGFCLAEDVERELAQHPDSCALASAALEKPAPREEAKTSASEATLPALSEPAREIVEKADSALPVEKAVETQPWNAPPSKPKNWLKRLLSFGPDAPEEPRKAAREALSGLSAYFWDGGVPKAHEIRDISAKGLYVVTHERWYPGTLVQMTLKKASGNGVKADSSISLMARANRWGNDGVGLGFVVRDPRRPSSDDSHAMEREELDRFLALQQKS